MSGYSSETLSEAVARNRVAICPTPGCGELGQVVGPAVIMYHLGVALVSLNARLYRCTECGIQFAVAEEK